MKILRMTTALVAGLSILQPTVIEAQGNAGSSCVAAQIADGKSANEARRICAGQGGGGGNAVKPPKPQKKTHEPFDTPLQQQRRAVPATPAMPGLRPAQPARPPKTAQPTPLQPKPAKPQPATPQPLQPKPAKPQPSQGADAVWPNRNRNQNQNQNQNRVQLPGQQARPERTPVPTTPFWQKPPREAPSPRTPQPGTPKPAKPQAGGLPPVVAQPSDNPPVPRQPKPAKPQPGGQLPAQMQPKPAKPQPGVRPVPGQQPGNRPPPQVVPLLPGQQQARPGLQPPQPQRLPPNLRDALDSQNRLPPRPVPVLPVKPPRNEALSAGIDPKAPPPPGVRIQRQVFTRENTRRPGQDFHTNPYGQPRAHKKDSGLSDLEKLAILGLGALAVGALLNNGSRVAANSGDRVVVRNPDGSYSVLKDDDVLMRQPGTTMSSESYPDGSLRTVATKPDGTQIVTLYDPMRRIVKRVRIDPDGRRYVLIDDSRDLAPVDYATLPAPTGYYSSSNNEAALREALAAQNPANRAFSLAQIRQIEQVRALAPAVTVQNVIFPSGSAAIGPDQAPALSELGRTMQDMIAANPEEVFLVEGHTDAVGDPAYNLALSDRRAESLALALSDYYGVPSENMVVQGYGEEELLVPTSGAEAANRRTVVRRITGLLDVAQE